MVEALLTNEAMDRVARYLSRGRCLQSLDEPTLKRLWIDELRDRLRDASCSSTSSEDISTELSLRGIKRVELPSDLKAEIQSEYAKIRKAMEDYPELRQDTFKEIAQFELRR